MSVDIGTVVCVFCVVVAFFLGQLSSWMLLRGVSRQDQLVYSTPVVHGPDLNPEAEKWFQKMKSDFKHITGKDVSDYDVSAQPPIYEFPVFGDVGSPADVARKQRENMVEG